MPKKIISSKKKGSAKGGLSEWMPIIQVLAVFIGISVILYFVITLPPGWPNNPRKKTPTAVGIPAATQSFSTPAGPVSELGADMVGPCANKFWPVLEGSVWTYDITHTDAAGASSTWRENWLLLRVEQTDEYAYDFTLSVSRGEEIEEVVYSCSREGVFRPRPDSSDLQLVIFPEQAMRSGQSWNLGGLSVTVSGASPQRTPAGSFQTVSVTTFDGGQQENAFYAPSVGLVRRVVTGDAFGLLEMVLASFAVAQ